MFFSNLRFVSSRSVYYSLSALILISFLVVLDRTTFNSIDKFYSVHAEQNEQQNNSLSSQHSKFFTTTRSFTQNSTTWDPPSVFDSQLSVFTREDKFTKQQLRYPWYRPLVYLYSTRLSFRNESELVLYLYTQGIHMGGTVGFQRNFTAVGCLVGSKVYPLIFLSGDELYICVVSHDIKDGEFLSVVIKGDKYVKESLKKRPIQLNHDVNVTLEDGDINLLPKHYHVDHRVLVKTNGTELYYARSTVKFQGNEKWKTLKERKETPRYEICGCTQNKIYPHLMEPWVNYHRRIGMDLMIIIDNDATEDLQKMFANRSDVKVYYWPYGRSQSQIWSYIQQKALSMCEWFLPFDSDEYVMFGIGETMRYANRRPLKMYTDKLRKNGTVAVSIFYMLVDSSEQERIPDDPPPKVYVHASRSQYGHGKMMINMDYSWTKASIHRHYNLNNRVPSENEGFARTRSGIIVRPVSIDDDPALIHYRIRSWEEWTIKSETDRADMVPTYNISTQNDAKKKFLRKKRDDLLYTHFKDIWKAVTERATMNFQTLVRTKDGKRCHSTIETKDRLVVHESCEVVQEVQKR